MNVDPVIGGVVASAIVGLQCWTLQQMVGVKIKLAKMGLILSRLPCEQNRPTGCPAEEREEP
jgi:hypothetical protein